MGLERSETDEEIGDIEGEGVFSIDVHNVVADGDLVVVLVNAQRNGVATSFTELHVWRLKNGKATEFREYQGDEQRVDRFWS